VHGHVFVIWAQVKHKRLDCQKVVSLAVLFFGALWGGGSEGEFERLAGGGRLSVSLSNNAQKPGFSHPTQLLKEDWVLPILGT
jgi:hypothetical protein